MFLNAIIHKSRLQAGLHLDHCAFVDVADNLASRSGFQKKAFQKLIFHDSYAKFLRV